MHTEMQEKFQVFEPPPHTNNIINSSAKIILSKNTFKIQYFNKDFYITLWLKPTTIDTSYSVSAVVGF